MQEELPQEFLEKLLFLGSISQKTNLQPTPSKYFTYNTSKLARSSDFESRNHALIPRFPMDYLGSEYKSLFLPCTPAKEIMMQGTNLSDLDPCQKIEFIDKTADVLSFGFLKTSKSTGFSGYRSGRRSAIYYDSEKKKFYRLKGCGNDESGFVVSIGKVNLDPNSKEIRGCHYFHTVKRELFMTQEINTFLQEFGYETGNKSHGFWLYSEEIPPELNNVFPKIPKFCGVFETFGEKRVATHLFQGFEALWREIIRISDIIEGFLIDITSIFPKDRVLPGGDFVNTPVNFDLAVDETPLIDFFQCILEKKLVFPLNNGNHLIITKFLPEIIKNLKIKPPYSVIFEKIFESLFEANEGFDDFFKLAGILYGRIGFETGQIKEIFTKKKINWGYYYDHHPYLAHCNAHPNNFIVLPDDHPGVNLLAPLDFDLAFHQNEFININYDDKTYGEYDEQIFNDFVQNENISLELALTGLENMDNFQYCSMESEKIDNEKQTVFEATKILFRDCLRIFYLRGKSLKEEFSVEAIPWKKYKKIYDLIKLCLIITNDCLG